MNRIAYNDIAIERPRRTHTHHYLTFRDDQRPACTLVLGDGFTQGLLRAVDLHSIITCGVNSLIPAPSHVSYFPVAGDRFGRDELFWDPVKWPLMSQAAASRGLAGIELFNAIGVDAELGVKRDNCLVGWNDRFLGQYIANTANQHSQNHNQDTHANHLLAGQEYSSNFTIIKGPSLCYSASH